MLLKRAVLLALLAVACNPCTSDHAAGGATPFSRCLLRGPGDLPGRVGPLTIQAAGRTLTLGGLPAEPRVAVFQAPGMATSLEPGSTLNRLASEKADVLLVLGGLGLDPEAAKVHLGRLASVGPPVLFLAGGRDSGEAIDAAQSALTPVQRSNVIDLTPYQAVALPGYTLVLVAGSEAGREAIHESACGFSPDDLESIEDAAKAVPGTRRLLVSWEIPAGSSLAAPTRAGDSAERLGAFRDEIGCELGVHAWPDLKVMRPTTGKGDSLAWGATTKELQLAVPRLYGPTHTRVDGTREPPGYAILRLGKEGVSVVRPR